MSGTIGYGTSLRAALFVLLLPAVSLAQTVPATGPDLSRMRLRLGALYLNPTLSLTNFGVDTNVFNEPDQRVPKDDFTFTLTPAADAYLRFGRTWFTGNVKEDVVWYQKYASERSGNTSYSLDWLAPLNRVTARAGVVWLDTRERPGFEIDARARRNELTYRGSAELRVLSRTLFGVRADRRRVDFAQDQFFLGTNLQNELNRTIVSAALTVRHEVTPLTSLTFSAGRQRDEFEFSPLRDADSTEIQGGVAFDPAALLKGSATFGYRNFKPADPTLPGFKGTTMGVGLSYVAGGATQLTFNADRDVQYSYEVDNPYYIQTGGNGQIAQQIYGPIEALVRFGVEQLAYRQRGAAAADPVSRTDYAHRWGAGVAYHMGPSIRIGGNVDKETRTSTDATRAYHGLRLGISITYGIE